MLTATATHGTHPTSTFAPPAPYRPERSRAVSDPSDAGDARSLWERLRWNVGTNRGIFAAAGIGDELVRSLRCRSCGLNEKAYFWSVERRGGDTLHLQCPQCASYRVRYDIPGNRVSRPVTPAEATRTGAGALGLLLLAVGIWYGTQLPALRAEADQVGGLLVATAVSAYPDGAPGSQALSRYHPSTGGPGTTAVTRIPSMQAILHGATSSAALFASEGDRRQEIARYLDELEPTYGLEVRRDLMDLRYDAASDETVVQVSGSRWQRVMESDQAWKRVG